MVPLLSDARCPAVTPSRNWVPGLWENGNKFVSTGVLNDTGTSHDLGAVGSEASSATAAMEPDVGFAFLSEALGGNVDESVIVHSIKLLAIVRSRAEWSLIKLVQLAVSVVLIVHREHWLLHQMLERLSGGVIATVDGAADAAVGACLPRVVRRDWQRVWIDVAAIRVLLGNIRAVLFPVVRGLLWRRRPGQVVRLAAPNVDVHVGVSACSVVHYRLVRLAQMSRGAWSSTGNGSSALELLVKNGEHVIRHEAAT